MIIPYIQLEPDTLRAVIEEFVTRHGAVHGHADAPLEQQVKEILEQLRTGQAAVVFEEKEETCSIMTMQEARQAEQDRDSPVDATEEREEA